MVDIGTTTVIPRPILAGLGICPAQQDTFEYVNGQSVALDLAEARARVDGSSAPRGRRPALPRGLRVDGRETITWIIFGDAGMSPLLGAYTLEGVRLGVDPYNERLIPVVGSLK